MTAPITLIIHFEKIEDDLEVTGKKEFRGDSYKGVHDAACAWFRRAEQSPGFHVVRMGLTKHGEVADLLGRGDH